MIRRKDYEEQLDRRVREAVEFLAGIYEDRFGVDLWITDIFREDGHSPHHYWRAVDVRTRNLPLTHAQKQGLADEVDVWCRGQYGDYDKRYCIYEWPNHLILRYRKPEHFHIQVYFKK